MQHKCTSILLLLGVLLVCGSDASGQSLARLECGDVALRYVAVLELAQSDRAREAIDGFTELIPCLEQTGDKLRLGRALYFTGFLMTIQGESGGAAAVLSRAVAVCGQSGDGEFEGLARYYLGGCLVRQGDFAAARLEHERSIERLAGNGHYDVVSGAHRQIGRCYAKEKRPRAALEFFVRAIEIARDHQYPESEALAQWALGLAYVDLHDKKSARNALLEAKRLFDAVGNSTSAASVATLLRDL